MQAFCCDVVRAFTKLGIAIAANRPIMATTIMISTSVNPPLRDVPLFILAFLWLRREQSSRRLFINTSLFTNCQLLTVVPPYQIWDTNGNPSFPVTRVRDE